MKSQGENSSLSSSLWPLLNNQHHVHNSSVWSNFLLMLLIIRDDLLSLPSICLKLQARGELLVFGAWKKLRADKLVLVLFLSNIWTVVPRSSILLAHDETLALYYMSSQVQRARNYYSII
ncbi:hypothetical protein AB3S75_000465 [Citrus x aurantiifolia]